MGSNGRIEHRRGEPLILGKQIVSILMKVADAADSRGASDNLSHVAHQLGKKRSILGVALNEAITRMPRRSRTQWPVLGEVVQSDNLMAGLQQFLDQITADETRGAR